MDIPSLDKYLPQMCVAVPPLGEDLESFAQASDRPVDDVLKALLFERRKWSVPFTVTPGNRKNFQWRSGHGINDLVAERYGPRREYRAMIIGQCIGFTEIRTGELFSGNAGVVLRQAMQQADPQHSAEYYLTSVLKTTPFVQKKFLKSWIKAQQAALMLEIMLTKPKYILTLGTQATAFIFGKKKFKMQSAEGRWHEISFDMRSAEQAADYNTELKEYKKEHQRQLRQAVKSGASAELFSYPEFHHPHPPGSNDFTCQVMPCMNPAALEYEKLPEEKERFFKTVANFVDAVESESSTEKLRVSAEVKQRYEVVRDLPTLKKTLARAEGLIEKGYIGVDGEWQGAHPQNKGSFLRCIQFGWHKGEACVLHRTNNKGELDFADDHGTKGKPALLEAYSLIKQFMANNGARVAGFFYGADHEWLAYDGLDLMPWYEAAPTLEEAPTKGGFGVELAVAAIDELSSNNLETVRWRFTQCEDYFAPFDAFKQEAALGSAVEKHVQKAGYGWIPDEVLYPYAGGDADVTVQAAHKLTELLNADRFGLNCWLPYWRAHKASPVVAEIMRTGMPFSQRVCAELADAYAAALQRHIVPLRKSLNWPDFDVDGWQKLCIAMFGRRYSPFKDKETGEPINKRPEGARTLNLEPVVDNDSASPRSWDEIRAGGLENERTPGTGAKALGILRNSTNGVAARRQVAPGKFEVIQIPVPDQLQAIFDCKSIRQVQKNFVGSLSIANDNIEFEGGYATHVCDDNYLRCFMSQVKETGRWSAAMPNLHNMPKRKENNYKKALRDLYVGKLRRFIVAPPGYVIMECDYSSAELFMLAIASGDEVLWEHCQRNLLPEDHVNFFDPHANLCVQGFGLDCGPNKTGLKSVGMSHLRDVAKCFAADTFIHTEKGLVRVSRLCPGLKPGEKTTQALVDEVQGLTENTPLLAISNEGSEPCVRVVLENGLSLTTTADHRHYVMSSRGAIGEIEAADVTTGMYMFASGESGGLCEVPPMDASVESAMLRCSASEEASRPGPEMCRVLGLFNSVSGAKADKAGRALLSVGDYNEARTRAVVDALQGVAGDDSAAAACKSGKHHFVYVSSAILVGLMATVRKRAWSLIPDHVLLWPHECRLAFLWGVAWPRMRGAAQGRCILLPEKDAETFQIAAQSCGYVVNIESRTTGDLRRVVAADGPTLAWFEAICTGEEMQEEILQGPETFLPKNYPVAYYWASKVASRVGLAIPEIDGPINYSMPTEQVLEVFDILGENLGSLYPVEREIVARFQQVFEGQLRPLAVLTVETVSHRIVYDVQTTDAQRHVVMANGVSSHNSVIYGWAYGRSAPAVQLGAKEEGITVSLESVEKLLNTIETQYHDAHVMLEAAAARVNDGYLYTPMGRVRRCPESDDNKKLNAYGREFKNAPIQGGVADVVNEAGYNLRKARAERNMSWHFIMQIHDAFLFLVPYHEVYEMANEVVPKAMCTDIPIVPYRLDGSRVQNQQPKILGCNVDLTFAWGESATEDELLAVGIDPSKIERLE